MCPPGSRPSSTPRHGGGRSGSRSSPRCWPCSPRPPPWFSTAGSSCSSTPNTTPPQPTVPDDAVQRLGASSLDGSTRPMGDPHLTYPEAVVIGLLQGVTELFPVSSLGHSVLIPAIIGGRWAKDLSLTADKSPYLTFLVAVHVATAVALV